MYKAITTPHGLSFSCHIGWLPSKSKRHENDFKRLLGSWNSTLGKFNAQIVYLNGNKTSEDETN
jgi:hypothetical protein